MQIQFQENVPLSEWGRYKIGGKSRYFFEAKTIDEVKDAMRIAREKNVPVFVLGNGTNLLINDNGFGGLVMKPSIRTLTQNGTHIEAGAGITMQELWEFAIAHGLSGFEWAGGLPGTVGGAIRGNAGCFGGEIKDNVARVTSVSVATGEVRERSAEECRFGYRTSIFKESAEKEVIVAATFVLHEGEKEKIRTAIEEKVRYRTDRHPMEHPNIGSIFKNVPLENVPEAIRSAVAHVVKQDPFPVVPAAFLISETGLKERTAGGAMISPKHPNFIVNMGNATARDVETLIAIVKDAVKSKFGIELEEEVQRL